MTAHPSDLLTQADPDVVDRLTAIGEFSLNAGNLAQMRTQPIRTPVALSDAVERRDYRVPGPPGAPDVAVRVHRPRNAGPALPCLVSMHGGGYVMGTHLGGDGRFDAWCPRFGCVGVSVGYRLAPETPFPGPLEAWLDEKLHAAPQRLLQRLALSGHAEEAIQAARGGISGVVGTQLLQQEQRGAHHIIGCELIGPPEGAAETILPPPR